MGVDGGKKKGRRKGKGSGTRNNNTSSSAISRASSPRASSPLPTSKKDTAASSSSTSPPSKPLAPAALPKQKEEEEEEKKNDEPQLVLLGEKRRGLYECDYCRSDVSQVPRVRCAVCPDFDLCLDCFATTDPTALSAIRDGLTNVMAALEEDEDDGKDGAGGGGGGVGGGVVPGVSAAAVNHCHTHGYRVADSTRFALFPTARGVHKIETEAKEEEEKDEEKKRESKKLKMDKKETLEKENLENQNSKKEEEKYVVTDDAKAVWTAEEDLRLLDAIQTFGLGNWADISEAVSNGGSLSSEGNENGNVSSSGSVLSGVGGGAGGIGAGGVAAPNAKSARRCMERYCDDFLGRYGHILPPYTLVQIQDEDEEEKKDNDDNEKEEEENKMKEERPTLERKRKRLDRQSSIVSSISSSGESPTAASTAQPVASFGGLARQQSIQNLAQHTKKYKVIPTTSLDNYEEIWPFPHLPTLPGNVTPQMGDEVGRDLAFKLEQSYVKATNSTSSATNTTNTQEEVHQLRQEFIQKRLQEMKQLNYSQQQITLQSKSQVFPPPIQDIRSLPGAELAGFMPRRGDFDMEYDNDAETILADMEFSPNDHPQDKLLKLQILEIYNQKLDERERRKNFLVSHNLLDYRKNQDYDNNLKKHHPEDLDLIHRMRLFARFHTPSQHKEFIQDLCKAKRLRREIAKLQMYRKLGITSLAEAEKYECDKNRRAHHKIAHLQKLVEEEKAEKEMERKVKEGASILQDEGIGENESGVGVGEGSVALWRQYRGSDRKTRRSRSMSSGNGNNSDAGTAGSGEKDKNDTSSTTTSNDNKTKTDEENKDKMDIDTADNKNQTDEEDKNNKNKNNTTTTTFDITQYKGYDLLSSREADLCESLHLLPAHYLHVKRELIRESLEAGLLDSSGSSSTGRKGNGGSATGDSSAAARSIVKLDVKKRDNVIDFVLRSGWIPMKPCADMVKALSKENGGKEKEGGGGGGGDSVGSLAAKISAAMSSNKDSNNAAAAGASSSLGEAAVEAAPASETV